VPGELTDSGKFEWSPFIFTEGGDWLTASHNRVIKFHHIDTIIIDIETDAATVLQTPIDSAFTGLCLVPTFLNTNELEALYSTGIIHEARFLASVVPIIDTETFPVLLKMNTLNWMNQQHVATTSVTITHIAPLRSYLPKNREIFLMRLSDLVSNLGLEFKTGSVEEIDEVLRTVHRMQHNTPHVTTWAKVDTSYELLGLFQRVRHMTHLQAQDFLTSLPYRAQRTLYLLLANYWPDGDTYAESLVRSKRGLH
jgi:hypothetical protein